MSGSIWVVSCPAGPDAGDPSACWGNQLVVEVQADVPFDFNSLDVQGLIDAFGAGFAALGIPLAAILAVRLVLKFIRSS